MLNSIEYDDESISSVKNLSLKSITKRKSLRSVENSNLNNNNNNGSNNNNLSEGENKNINLVNKRVSFGDKIFILE
jgi:hypothetical protein